MKNQLKKLTLALSMLSLAAFMGCSTDNPIEIENGRMDEDIGFDIGQFEKDLAKAEESYNKDHFPESSSSSEESSSSLGYPYLLNNMNLKITLKSYKQVVKSMSEEDPIGDPEIRFGVKFFSDGIQVRMAVTEEYTISPVLLREKNLKEWTGVSVVTVDITRGIDEVRLCPMVKDLDEDDEAETPKDVDISSGECYAVKEIGYLTGPVKQGESNEKFDLSWEMELFE